MAKIDVKFMKMSKECAKELHSQSVPKHKEKEDTNKKETQAKEAKK